MEHHKTMLPVDPLSRISTYPTKLVSRVSLKYSEQQFLDKAVAIVSANLEDSTFSTNDFAQQMLLSRTHLHRKLKAITNLSASGFIRAIRLQRAIQLLREGIEPVSQIAYQVGFNNLSYFAKCFKQQYGFAPSTYKK